MSGLDLVFRVEIRSKVETMKRKDGVLQRLTSSTSCMLHPLGIEIASCEPLVPTSFWPGSWPNAAGRARYSGPTHSELLRCNGVS
jgi:hypothetical protein